MKKNIKSITDNFLYLFHELYLFRRSSVILPFLESASWIFLSLITIWIPKMILDLIENRADLNPRRVHSPMLASQQTFP